MTRESMLKKSHSNAECSPERPLFTDGGIPSDRQRVLPPADARPTHILALSGAIVQQYHVETLLALVESVHPDAIVAVPPFANSVAPAIRRRLNTPILQPGRGMRPDSITAGNDEILIVAPPASDRSLTIEAIPDHLSTKETSDSEGESQGKLPEHYCIVTDALSLSVDPYERSAGVEGFSEYSDRLPTEWSHDRMTHLSTALRAGFTTTLGDRLEQNSATIVGVGNSEANLGVGHERADTSATVVSIYHNGAVSTETVQPERFGLRSLTQVGQQRAETLRQAGFESPSAIAETNVAAIAQLPKIGSRTAVTIHTAAKATATGCVMPTGDDSLPHGDPVFIDIETDGRNPSTAWLIGVLDGDVENGNYLAFREMRPGDGTHLDAFMTWLTGTAMGRPVVAWHGYNFDFPVIEDQLRQHCPEYVDAWNESYCFDPLYWARDKNGGNAALPGRTNKLEAVARPLGWEPTTTGIDGQTIAEVYVAWRTRFERASDPRSVTEPPWDRLERYCEDDVRALATIYEALRDAARRDPHSSTPVSENSTQGALSDFT